MARTRARKLSIVPRIVRSAVTVGVIPACVTGTAGCSRREAPVVAAMVGTLASATAASAPDAGVGVAQAPPPPVVAAYAPPPPTVTTPTVTAPTRTVPTRAPPAGGQFTPVVAALLRPPRNDL
jgi:hypothetical protein